MSEDATLDDFFESANDGTAGCERDSDRPGDESVAAFDPTFRWTPGGKPCADCGRAVERRWAEEGDGNGGRDDGIAFVCRDCKQW